VGREYPLADLLLLKCRLYGVIFGGSHYRANRLNFQRVINCGGGYRQLVLKEQHNLCAAFLV
jgi:hypothetical protein